jgi:hypothetical protein
MTTSITNSEPILADINAADIVVNAGDRNATNPKDDVSDESVARKGGRKIGTTLNVKQDILATIKLVTHSVGRKYLDIQSAPKFAGKKGKHTFENVLQKQENEFALTKSSIIKDPVKHFENQKNLSRNVQQ